MESQEIISKHAVSLFGAGTTPIVFAHGLGCDKTMWKDIFPSFEGSNKVILFDLMGFGQSDHTYFSYEQYQSLEDYADDCIDIIKNTCLEPVVFVGHSVSAMIGVLSARKRPDLFEKLVLIGPSPRYIDDGDYHGGFTETDIASLIDSMRSNYFGWAKHLAPVIMGNQDRPNLSKSLEDSFCRTNPEYAQHFASLTFWSDNRRDLALVKTPALVMQCAEDVIAPLSVGQYVAHQMPNSTFLQLKATGHCPHVSHPDEVIKEIKAYVGLCPKLN